MLLVLVLLHIPFSLAQQPDIADPPPGCGAYHKNFTIDPKWNKLFSAGRNLTLFYKNLTRGYGPGHELVRTAMIFLEEIEELERDVDTNRPHAMEAVWELYICGGPRHLRQIPYGEMIETFKWDSDDVDEYFTLISDTKRVWNRLLEELQRIAEKEEPDLII